MINLGPYTGADETSEWEGSGVAISCRNFNAALTCGARGLPWKQRPEGRPRGPATGTGVTLEIWNQLTMAASASSRERERRGEATLWPCGKAASLTIFYKCRM